MKTFLLSNIVGAIAFLSFATAGAQTFSPRALPSQQPLSTARQQKLLNEYRVSHPLDRGRMVVPQRQSNAVMGLKQHSRPVATQLKTAAGNTIWGNVMYMDEWSVMQTWPYGYYAFQPVASPQFNLLYQQERGYANNGVGYYDGHLYQLSMDDKFKSINICSEVLYDFDTSTWTRSNDTIARDSSQLRYELMALETAQGPDGTVYGQFYSHDGKRMEWGTIDYRTLQRTTFGQCTRTYVALGVTKQHELYGVAADGNLYKISTTDGTETLVGNTGLTVTANGGYYYQSGEIDPKDNTFYWAAVLPDGEGIKTGLYTVNLQTGTATKIGDYTGQILGMIIPHDNAEDDAPEAVSDLAVSFTAPSLTGTVSFTVPSRTFAGSALSGEVSYDVTANGQTVASGTAQAGEKVSKEVTLPKSGEYSFVVTTSTSAGSSPKASALQLVGYDIPDVPANVSATHTGNEATISWKAPTKGLNNGYMGELTYDVVRVNGTKQSSTTVAAATTATSVTDQLPEDADLGYYYYTVTAHNGDQVSATVMSNGFTFGSAITPDWHTEFGTQADFGLFTVVDANKDKRTWRYDEADKAAMSNYSSSNGNDDWLFTPGFRLSPDYTYKFIYKVRNVYEGYPNSLEVRWGTDTTAAAMTSTLLATTTPTAQWKVYEHEVTPSVSGIYYFGFHDNTAQRDQYALQLDSVAIVKSAALTAPDSVTMLSIVPGENGPSTAKVTFKLPSKNINGSKPSKTKSITKIVVKRDGEIFKSYPKAGATTTYSYGAKFDAGTDKNIPSGWHTYTVVCSNAEGEGREASKRVYIGLDAPKAPTGLKLHDDSTHITATWDAFTGKGANGAYLEPTDIAVSFFNHYENYYGQQVVGDSLTSSAKGATSLVLPQNPETSINRGAQGLYYLAARADGSMGKSSFVFTPSVVVGPTIALPFSESFHDGSVDNHFIWVEGNEQYTNRANSAAWYLEENGDADGTGGALFWKPYSETQSYVTTDYTVKAGDEASLNMPKVSLKGAQNPMLLFQLYATKNDPGKLKVMVQTPDGIDHDGKIIDLKQTAQAGWSRQSLSLKDYAGQRYVIVKFRGISEGDSTTVGIDNISIYNQPHYNLAATSLSAPVSVTAGAEATFSVGIRNTGVNAMSDYRVLLFANGAPVDTVTVNEPLASLADTCINMRYIVPVKVADSLKVYATIENSKDLDATDNTTQEADVIVMKSGYAAVSDLAAAKGKGASVSLTWSNPVIPEPQQVTEDFESYAPFSLSLGDWTMIDGDKGRVAPIFNSNPIPVYGKEFAFTAFNPNAIASDLNVLQIAPGLTPHSGNQFAAAVYSYRDGEVVDADNWLISPILSGNSQTVMFYVFNIAVSDGGTPTPYTEKFDVLYSTTNTDSAAFHKLESSEADGINLRNVAPNWKKVTVNLPEGATYFAIHHNTMANNTYIFGVDDVTFEKGTLGQNDSIVGFRIYRDGEYIGCCGGDTHVYIDPNGSEKSVYTIVVVYEDKDGHRYLSGVSNEASPSGATAVQAVNVQAAADEHVYNLVGQRVSRSYRGPVICNGRKFMQK